jgi:macrolide-specific efflux system membrane fusion protein
MSLPRRRKRFALLFLLLAATLFGGPVLSRFQSDAPESEALTTKVVLVDSKQAILTSGVLEPIQMVNVGAQASGQVTRLYVQLGQRVKAVDPIAEIDAVRQQSAMKMAEAALAATAAQKAARVAGLKLARISFERQKILHSRGATSRTDFETAENFYQVALSEVVAGPDAP